ncbi:MAG: tellurium resistance TerZ family protein [Candidatus Pacebacteria bacterium]|nr:tellurium resistance TerZ family protein [Candidatus Paceibacterota bacterium]
MTGINLSKSPNFVNLQKGSQLALPGSLRVVDLMLGWEPAVIYEQKVKDKSFFGLGKLINSVDSAVNTVTKAVDVDASVLLVNANGKVVNRVWFRNLHDTMNNIHHSGDNLTGKGDFPDETIHLKNLSEIHQDVQELHFWVNIYSGSQDFGDISECIAAVADMEKREELARVNLTGQYPGKSSIFLCAISRAPGGGWIFNSILEAFNEKRMEEIIHNHY